MKHGAGGGASTGGGGQQGGGGASTGRGGHERGGEGPQVGWGARVGGSSTGALCIGFTLCPSVYLLLISYFFRFLAPFSLVPFFFFFFTVFLSFCTQLLFL